MKRLIFASLTLLFAAYALPSGTAAATAQNTNSSTAAAAVAQEESKTGKPAVKRGPVFRATKEQIKQAQSILKGRGFFAGEDHGKLDDDTRAALRKYQEAESLKVTGTMNKATLEKMSIALTDKQKAWKPAT